MLLGVVGKAWLGYAPNYLMLILVGVVANIFGQLGDLSMSLVKREAGIKDYSHLFLTHGGMLDRFDSTLFLAARSCGLPVCGGLFMTRSIALLGSTGSIGRQTLEVARELGISVAALTANKSVDLIEQQAREFCPRLAVLYDEDAARELRARLSDTKHPKCSPVWRAFWPPPRRTTLTRSRPP